VARRDRHEIAHGGRRRVFESVQSRYAEQDRGFTLTKEYVDDLTTALAAEDRCRTYVARGPDGEYLSGIVVLYSNDAAYYWLGGSRDVRRHERQRTGALERHPTSPTAIRFLGRGVRPDGREHRADMSVQK